MLGPKLLVVDEIGYPPFGHDEANLFFNVVAQHYKRSSMVSTSNLPFTQLVAFAKYQTLTTAMLDQLLHHPRVVQVTGDSYRLKDKRKAGQTARRMTPGGMSGGTALLGRFGLRPAQPSSAMSRTQVGQIYFINLGESGSDLLRR